MSILRDTLKAYDEMVFEGCKQEPKDEGVTWSSSQAPPEEPARMLYNRPIKTDWSLIPKPKAGLANLSNSSYMNAVIQSLLHIPAFVDWLHNEKCTNLNQDCITCQAKILLKLMCQECVVEPSNMLLLCRKIRCGRYTSYEYDPFFYVSGILELMHDEFMQRFQPNEVDFWSEKTAPLFQIFGVIMKLKNECSLCTKFEEQYLSCMCLEINITKACSLHQAFHQWLTSPPKYLYNCHCTVTHEEGLIKWPPVLVLKLDRFEENGNKILNPLDICLSLSVKDSTYKMSSVILHSGSNLEGGYLTTLASEADGTLTLYEDSRVSKVSVHTFLQSPVYKLNAYIVVYEQTRTSLASSQGKALTSLKKAKSTTITYSTAPQGKAPNSGGKAQSKQHLCHVFTSTLPIIDQIDRHKSTIPLGQPRPLKKQKLDYSIRLVSKNADKKTTLRHSLLKKHEPKAETKPRMTQNSRSLLRPRHLSEQCTSSDSQNLNNKESKVEAAQKLLSHSGPVVLHTSTLHSNDVLGHAGQEVSVPRETASTRSIGIQVNVSRSCLCYEDFKHLPIKKFLFFTGFTQENFLVLYNFLGGSNIISELKLNFRSESHLRKFLRIEIPPKDKLLITLVRLKRGLPIADVANLFNISVAQGTNLFYTMIKHISLTFQRFKDKMFISAKDQEKSKPAVFKNFRNLRVILDVVEFKVQRSPEIAEQSITYSNKVFFIVGVSCCGRVIFISSGHEGNISEKDAILNCGLLEKLNRDDSVMIEHDLDIAAHLSKIGVNLIKPPQADDSRFSTPKEEDVCVAAMAEARAYFKRLKGKIKQNRLLRCIIPFKLLPLLPDMVITAACLENFSHQSEKLEKPCQ